MSAATERVPVVAGRFYPGDAEELADDVAKRMGTCTARPAIAIVGPHAGYVYSGSIAAETWARVDVPQRVILLCPNHTGLGVRCSMWSGGAWRIPGTRLAIDVELRDALAVHTELELDAAAHLREHAIEVHLPMLAARRPDARIVPICLGRLDAARCRTLGEGLARAIASVDEPVLVVASTDMSHYIPADVAAELDGHALARLLALDPDGLHRVVERERISMCGYVPTTVALSCALARGATSATLVRYGHSGEASGDHERVVGYAGAIVA
jgi:AmmeMemoRadiSam system protein B